MDEDTYWIIDIKALAFETEAEADVFMHRLIDTFCEMPEAEGYAFSAKVKQVTDRELSTDAD